MTAYPASLRSFKGDRLLFLNPALETAALLDRLTKSELLAPEIPALGSVGVTALYVAGRDYGWPPYSFAVWISAI